MERTSVPTPSFGSFPQAAPVLAEQLGESSSRRKPVHSRRAPSTRDSEASGKEHRHRSHRVIGDIPRSEGSRQDQHVHLTGQDFYTDRVGDKDALRYGVDASRANHRYRRSDGGRLLGLPGQYRAVNLAGKSTQGLEVAKSGQSYIPRYATGYKENSKRLRFRSTLDEPDYTASYIAIDATRPHTLDTEDDHEEADLEDHAAQRHSHLQSRLASRPDDVDTWIAFSKAHLTEDEGHRRAELDVSLAILERALGSLSESIALHLEYLRIAAELWPTARVEEAWKVLFRRIDQGSFSDTSAFQIRLGYLNWIQGSGFGGGNRNGDRVLAAFEEAVSSSVSEEDKLYIFTRACFFLAQMGYEEKAMAAFQALLELTLARLHPRETFDQLLDEYEDHWDSDAPKLGETGARGWRARPSEVITNETAGSDEIVKILPTDRYQQWAQAECRSAARNRMPAKMGELDEDESDPHRSVVFTDIRPLMFPIRSPDLAEQLCWTFLHFLGLPLRPPGAPSNVAISNDPHLCSFGSSRHFWPEQKPRQSPWRNEIGEMDDSQQTLPTSPVGCCATDRENVWSTEWFQTLPGAFRDRDIALMRNGIEIIARHFPSPKVEIYALALEAAVSIKGAMKVAKSRLANDRNNLTLWAAYARLERLKGKTQAARAIYAAALAPDGSMPTMEESPRLALVADWALMEWTANEQERCLGLLVAFANGQSLNESPEDTTKMALLKARQFYSHDPMSSSAMVLSALFTYQTDPNRALENVQSQLAVLDGYDQEVAFQFHIELLRLHTTRHPGPASAVRGHVEHAARQFPDNTQFLDTMLSLQAKSGLHSRLHALTARLTGSDSRLVGMVWAVWAEAVLATDLYHPGSGGASRVRSLLRRALGSIRGRQCPTIWLRAIEFETKVGRHQAAKKLFYRAMAHIGTCKELYLMPFQEPLRPYFTESELGQIVESMIDRGIRLQCDPGDFWTSHLAEADLPSDEEPHDDELRFLTERQALKPY